MPKEIGNGRGVLQDEKNAEHDKIFSLSQTSASARVVNQLLTEMDGLEARRQVFIMAATNRPGEPSPPSNASAELCINSPRLCSCYQSLV